MRVFLSLVATGLLALLAGCTALCGPNCGTTHQRSSSLVEFLYPNGAEPPRQNSIPELHVPLRVGLAFLPGVGGTGPDAALKERLLERVRAHFSDRKFVSEIVVIPDYYLGSQRGFSGLEAVQRLYSVDVMALVSYDQVMHDDENAWSLGYVTIVGAYVLKGDRYDFSTLVDLAVVDPATHSLILRAGGVDTHHGDASITDLARKTRDAGAMSFSAASDQMIAHLDTALSDFEASVRAGHANVRVVSKQGSGGGGALSWPWLLPLALLAFLRVRRRLGAGPDPERRSANRPPLPRGGVPPVMRAPRLSGFD